MPEHVDQPAHRRCLLLAVLAGIDFLYERRRLIVLSLNVCLLCARPRVTKPAGSALARSSFILLGKRNDLFRIRGSHHSHALLAQSSSTLLLLHVAVGEEQELLLISGKELQLSLIFLVLHVSLVERIKDRRQCVPARQLLLKLR